MKITQNKLNTVLKRADDALQRLKEVNHANDVLRNKIDLLESDIATKNSMVIDVIADIENGESTNLKTITSSLAEILYDVPRCELKELQA